MSSIAPVLAAPPVGTNFVHWTRPKTLPPLARGLSALAWTTAAAAYLLITAGGLVTSTGSSLAVPDWPLSFGRFMPEMTGGVLFEHGHRLIAAVVASLVLITALWIRLKDPRPLVRRLAFAAAAGIMLQALLGGATVLLRLPPAVSIAHACLGQLVFCMIVAVAQTTSPWYFRVAPGIAETASPSWKIGALFLAAGVFQLFLGAIVRHSGHGLLGHALWAAGVTAAGLLVVLRGLKARRYTSALVWPSLLLAGLIPLQISLGLIAWRLKSAVDFQVGVHGPAFLMTAHVSTGALILALAVVWTLRAQRLRC